MKKIKFWQGWLVKEMETKFIVKVGDYLIEYHYPKSLYEFEVLGEQ